MDLALWALNHDVPASELARVLDIDTGRMREAVYDDIRQQAPHDALPASRVPCWSGEVTELDLH